MAEQRRAVLVTQDLRPAFYDDFQCLAGGCRLSCCKRSWRITFGKKDYLALKRMELSPELGARMEKGLRRIRNNLVEREYGEFDMSSGACPLLREDGLCLLQLEKGHEALSEVCRTFPRMEKYSFGYLERALSPACEGVLELLWNLPEGVEFRSDPLPKALRREVSVPESETMAPWFAVIREWCVDTLQDRRFPLPERMLRMGLGLRRLAEGETDVAAWLSWARSLPEAADLSLERKGGGLEKYLTYVVRSFMSMGYSLPDFHPVWEEADRWLGVAKKQDAEGNIQLTIPLAPYQEAAERYEAAFGDRAYFMENLMVAQMFLMNMPFCSSPDHLWRGYASLCSCYSIFRFMAVMSCREGTGDKAELIRLLVHGAQALAHNQATRLRFREELFQNGSATLAHLAVLLSG